MIMRFSFLALASPPRLLRSRPDAGRKLLSDSGLLKDLSFDEPFLGEEQVLEGKAPC